MLISNKTKTTIPLLIILISFITVFFVFQSISQVFASSPDPTEVPKINLQDSTRYYETTAKSAGIQKEANLASVAAIVIQSVLALLGVIFTILIMYGGFKWMTAAGNDQKIAEAKKLIVNAVIGLAIVMAAFSISIFVTEALESI